MIWHTNPWINTPRFQHPARTIISLQKDDFEIMGELTDVCGQIEFSMPMSRTNWQTRRTLDSERIGSSCHKMERSVRQKVGETDAPRIICKFAMLETKPVN